MLNVAQDVKLLEAFRAIEGALGGRRGVAWRAGGVPLCWLGLVDGRIELRGARGEQHSLAVCDDTLHGRIGRTLLEYAEAYMLGPSRLQRSAC